jgi:hypothetical protein
MQRTETPTRPASLTNCGGHYHIPGLPRMWQQKQGDRLQAQVSGRAPLMVPRGDGLPLIKHGFHLGRPNDSPQKLGLHQSSLADR